MSKLSLVAFTLRSEIVASSLPYSARFRQRG
jgi:hypothetical protein